MSDDLLDEFEVKRSAPSRSSKWLRIFQFILPLTMLVGFGLSLIEVESIMGSGPFLAIFSLIVLIFAVVRRLMRSIIAASFGLFSIFLVFMVIFGFQLSPSKAQGPIPGLILLLTAVMVALSTFAYFERPKE